MPKEAPKKLLTNTKLFIIIIIFPILRGSCISIIIIIIFNRTIFLYIILKIR